MSTDNRPRREIIAERMLTGVDSSRGRFSIRLGIGLPYQVGPDEWAGPVELEGLQPNLHDAHGNDSFQALMLAQWLAKNLLENFLEEGGRLLDDAGVAIDAVERLFESGVLR